MAVVLNEVNEKFLKDKESAIRTIDAEINAINMLKDSLV